MIWRVKNPIFGSTPISITSSRSNHGCQLWSTGRTLDGPPKRMTSRELVTHGIIRIWICDIVLYQRIAKSSSIESQATYLYGFLHTHHVLWKNRLFPVPWFQRKGCKRMSGTFSETSMCHMVCEWIFLHICTRCLNMVYIYIYIWTCIKNY